MNEATEKKAPGTGRGRLSLLVMAAVGFVPLVVAYLMFFYFPEWIPTGRTNEGTLIEPPLTVSELGDEAVRVIPSGKWTLIVAAGERCSEPCRKAVYLVRQINIGVGKDSERVQRVLVVTDNRLGDELRQLLDSEYPDMLVYFDPEGSATRALTRVLANGDTNGKIFLADPNGNIILHFDQEHGGKPILGDLKHLLRLSNIG